MKNRSFCGQVIPVAWKLHAGIALIGLSGLMLSTPSATAQGDAAAPNRKAAVHKLLLEVRKQFGVPAIAGAFITPSSITADCVGVRRLDKPDPVMQSDRFVVGSCTKSMTATLAGILVDEGKLSWDTTVSEAFPDFAAQIDTNLKQITLRQLLSHRAGLPPYQDPLDQLPFLSFPGPPRQQRHDVAQFVLSQPPKLPLGTYNYSNVGYTVAAAMIENAADDSYEYLLKSKLFDPLHAYVTFGFPGTAHPNAPWGHYEQAKGAPLPQDPDAYADVQTLLAEVSALPAGANLSDIPDFSAGNNLLANDAASVHPAGGVNLSVSDLARYVQLHLRGLLGRKTLLSPNTMRELHSSAYGAISSDTGGNQYYDLGWFQYPLGGVPTWFHSGEFNTFYALMVIQPSRRVAAVSLVNSGPNVSSEAVNTFVLQLLGITP